MSKQQRREQASKRARFIVSNGPMAEGFRELRKGSRAQPHRNKAKYRRVDFRNEMQRGVY